MPEQIGGRALPTIEDIAAAWREHTRALASIEQTIRDMQAAMLGAESRLHTHMEQIAQTIGRTQLADLEEQIRQLRIEFDARLQVVEQGLQVVEQELKERSVGGGS